LNPLLFNETWALSTVWLWARLGALFMFSPIFTVTKVPPSFVVLLTFVLAGLLNAAVGVRTAAPVTPAVFVIGVFTEVALGALLGFALHCAFAAFSLVGRLLDMQMGFGMGAIFDPVTQSASPVVALAMSLFGVALFFGVDGHLAMIRGLMFSISAVPPGTAWPALTADVVLRPVGAMFTVGVAIVSPVLFVLLMMEVALSITSRVLPQMNVFFVGVPAKILVGLVMLALCSQMMGSAMVKSYAGVFRFWDQVLR
jgi:flagellar biosynthetic protein FliR